MDKFDKAVFKIMIVVCTIMCTIYLGEIASAQKETADSAKQISISLKEISEHLGH